MSKSKGWVQIQQVLPGCEVEVEITGQVMTLLYKTEGSALVSRKKKVGCFGGTVEVDRSERVSLYTVVKVLKSAPPNFDYEKVLKESIKRSEGSRMLGSEPISARQSNKRAFGAYGLVDDLLITGGLSSNEIYEQVKTQFPEYTGSAASIASRKVALKKKNLLKGQVVPTRAGVAPKSRKQEGPYAMVDQLLIVGGKSNDIYEKVKTKYPGYTGSAASIASRKVALKKKGLLTIGQVQFEHKSKGPNNSKIDSVTEINIGASLFKTPYEMVNSFLAQGTKTPREIYGLVIESFPTYSGSVASISSKKSRSKK